MVRYLPDAASAAFDRQFKHRVAAVVAHLEHAAHQRVGVQRDAFQPLLVATAVGRLEAGE
jgi:hypothetical protein